MRHGLRMAGQSQSTISTFTFFEGLSHPKPEVPHHTPFAVQIEDLKRDINHLSYLQNYESTSSCVILFFFWLRHIQRQGEGGGSGVDLVYLFLKKISIGIRNHLLIC